MDLDDLLKEAYSGLILPECKRAVLEFMYDTKSVLNKDIIFVKALTKVADNIRLSDPSSLDGLLERLFQFNEEGIELIQKEKRGPSIYDKIHLLILESHFYGHKGGVSKAIFYKTGDVPWAEKWYKSYIQSARLGVDVDPKHSAHAYRHAGEAAYCLYEERKNRKLANKAIKCYKKFINYYELNPDPEMSKLIMHVKGRINYLVGASKKR